MPKLNIRKVWGALATLCVMSPAAGSLADPPPQAAAQEQWYVGGTLQKATVQEWLEATPQNQLATAADWLLTSKELKAKVEQTRDMSVVQPRADKLRLCVTRAVHRHADLYAKMPVSDIAMTCMLTLKP